MTFSIRRRKTSVISRAAIKSRESICFTLIQTTHAYNGQELMPSYGLYFSTEKTQVFITTDTQFRPEYYMEYYINADVIFHDCETSLFKSGVHAHYDELLTLPSEIKQKMWLYHYNPGPLPNAEAAGFCGFITCGQSFDFWLTSKTIIILGFSIGW